MRCTRLICYKLKSNVLQNRQVTIVTIHNYCKVYEVQGNVSFQHVHVGGDWWRKRRVVELYENFYAKSSFIKRLGIVTHYQFLNFQEEPKVHLPAQISPETHLQQGMCCKELQLSTDTELSFVSLPHVSLHLFPLKNKNHSAINFLFKER